jgi:hypothetical protein
MEIIFGQKSVPRERASLYLTKQLKSRLRMVANDEGASLNNICETFLELGMEEYEMGNKNQTSEDTPWLWD